MTVVCLDTHKFMKENKRVVVSSGILSKEEATQKGKDLQKGYMALLSAYNK